ncbi:MAG: carboxypeptidase-like regulatory domain-containing protein, partial [Muribaculaceae bacterium]|nr:carboxypeptidase-like regulatory domain-containing protein [Muribaculaceae bacterium]
MKLIAKNFRLLVSLWCLFVAAAAFAQVTLTGTITDSSGETMPGVSVKLKGNANIAAATNIDGRFALKLPNL